MQNSRISCSTIFSCSKNKLGNSAKSWLKLIRSRRCDRSFVVAVMLFLLISLPVKIGVPVIFGIVASKFIGIAWYSRPRLQRRSLQAHDAGHPRSNVNGGRPYARRAVQHIQGLQEGTIRRASRPYPRGFSCCGRMRTEDDLLAFGFASARFDIERGPGSCSIPKRIFIDCCPW
jgi:hypothetical protein